MRRLSPALAPTAALAVCALIRPPLAAQPRPALPARAEVARLADSLVGALMATNGIPAISVAIVRGTDTLLMRGWGKANLELDVNADARSVYRIGSITKQFTAAAVMQLVEAGAVKLDDPIGIYLPTLPSTWHAVTVRQLLNHTSGIRSYTAVGPTWVARWGEEMSPDTIVALVARDTFDFAPGSRWRYNNTGYVVLGMLVARVAGRPWSADLEQRFFKPLGLADTRDCRTQPLIPRRASGYSKGPTGWVNAPYLAMSQPYAAGALCSTVGDIARWNRALHTGKIVSAASYAAMTIPFGAAQASRYGFGLGTDTIASRTTVTHGGGINGFSSANLWVSDAELSVTTLTNGDDTSPGLLLKQLARAALGAPLLRPPTEVAITPAELAKYAGTYALALPGGARDFTFTVKDGRLVAQLAGQGANVLRYLGDHAFGADVDPSLRISFVVVGTRATKLLLKQGGGSYEGPRQ